MSMSSSVGRPREDHVPTVEGLCEFHGKVEFRLYPSRPAPGGGHYMKKRCPSCHAEKEAARRAAKIA